MSANTKIEWCDATVNWWAGCMKVSPACDNCYAERMAGRLWGTQWGATTPRHQFQGPAESLHALDRKAARLGSPLKVFHNSLSDMFDTAVPDEWRMEAFQCMADTPNLIHLVLTKRIGNVRPYTQRDGLAFDLIGEGRVWLGISICNQPEADRDIPKLLAMPAAKRFLSMEPLLGPVDLTPAYLPCPTSARHGGPMMDPSTGSYECCRKCDYTGIGNEMGIDWVIVGGESGPNARPMHPDWARSLRDQCEAAGVPFLFKQWGEWLPLSHQTGGADPEQKQCHIWLDGRPYDGTNELMTPECVQLSRVGKKAAGRLLDWRTWDGVPS